MKWILLIAIIVVILIIFGLWRRTQGVPGSSAPSRPVPPVAPAAEAGVDEVTGAPAAETRPPGHAEGAGGADPDGWWPDADEAPRERS